MGPGGSVPACLYQSLDEKRVRCHLCAHHCWIPEGKRGVCQVRKNVNGKLISLVYGLAISRNVDPIEKKPLYHYFPGTTAYSIATPGCNFSCAWCQNWSISQIPDEGDPLAGRRTHPHQLITYATAAKSSCIAYTYTEPTVFFEYAFETARLAREVGIGNVFVTNGYMTVEMLDAFQPYLDAANVDLKAFRKKTYHKYVGAGLTPILENMRTMKRMGVWLEVTTLVIPGINDDPGELREMAAFIALELGKDTPWHISRFFPSYRMADRPPTPLQTLRKAREIGLQAGLRYVYLGNVAWESNTHCHGCGRLLIRRRGYWISENHVQLGRCPSCGTAVAGIGLDTLGASSQV
jgi:pyruvate formate lyase activating enzyme